MDTKNLQELLAKISQLKSLRDAIKVFKSANLQKAPTEVPSNVIPIKQPPVQAPAQVPSTKESERGEAKKQISEFKQGKSYLNHLGIKDTGMNKRTHMIGLPGSDKHYEINVHLDKLGSKEPAFDINHVDSKGTVLSRHPQFHKNIGQAVKAVVGHHLTGKWE